MTETHWQLKLASRSLKKREKLKRILSFIGTTRNKECLEIGCEKGVLGYFLRLKGGRWHQADMDQRNVEVTKSLLKDRVYLINPERLNFSDHSFDYILAVDFLEHIENDELFLKELKRILKPEGHLYITVPKVSRGPFLDWLSRRLGINAAFYGHLRDGYTIRDLKDKLGKIRMKMVSAGCYSFFVTELIELLLNALYVRLSKVNGSAGIKGGISPQDPNEFKKSKKLFKIYSLMFPILFLFSRLDRLYKTGYVLIVQARNEEIN